MNAVMMILMDVIRFAQILMDLMLVTVILDMNSELMMKLALVSHTLCSSII